MGNILGVFILGVFSWLSSPAQTKADQSFFNLKNHLKKKIQLEVAKECPSCSVEFTIYDEEKLASFPIPDRVLTDHWKGETTLLLKKGRKTREVKVSIRWRDQVIVALKNIKQGELILSSMVGRVEKDVTYLKTAYASSLKNVIGMTGKRVFKRGQVIDEVLLKKPLVIRYGQPIKVFIDKGTLRLSMKGQARGAGAIGERIPVFIKNTRKKLFGIVVTENEVRVE